MRHLEISRATRIALKHTGANTSYVTLNKLINLSEPQFPHWNISTYHEGLLWGKLDAHLLSTYCVPGPTVGLESTVAQETNVVPSPGSWWTARQTRDRKKCNSGGPEVGSPWRRWTARSWAPRGCKADFSPTGKGGVRSQTHPERVQKEVGLHVGCWGVHPGGQLPTESQ